MILFRFCAIEIGLEKASRCFMLLIKEMQKAKKPFMHPRSTNRISKTKYNSEKT